MTVDELAADIDALIVITRHEGTADEQVAAVLRAALDEMVPTATVRGGRSRGRKPHPQPAIQVPIVVSRPKLRRWRTRQSEK